MTLSGRIPTSSSLTITAGRVFLISAPAVGSRFMSQISPLRMKRLTVQHGEGGQFLVLRIIWKEFSRSASEVGIESVGLARRRSLHFRANLVKQRLRDFELLRGGQPFELIQNL